VVEAPWRPLERVRLHRGGGRVPLCSFVGTTLITLCIFGMSCTGKTLEGGAFSNDLQGRCLPIVNFRVAAKPNANTVSYKLS
jgi:hypothetical protein